MSRIVTLLASLATVGLAHTALAQNRELGGTGELLDGIVALVDSGVVLKSELDFRMENVAANFVQQQMSLPPERRGQLPPRAILEDQVLDQLILEEIQLQRADKIGIEVSDDQVNLVLTDIAGNAGMTLEQLPQLLASEGIDYNRFRDEQKRELIIRTLERADVVSKITINPREFEQCMNRSVATQTDNFEYNISHILVAFSPDASSDEIAAAEAKIRDIGRQLDEGADFAQLAVAYSDAQTALEGGSLGWRKGSELPTVFATEVPKLKVGEHSTPIRGGGGFHIVRLNEMRGSEPTMIDQIHARHILLSPTAVLDDDATKQKLRGLREQIVNGDDFATLATAVSEDPQSAVDGGDLGWQTLDTFVPEFSSELASLEIGEVSEPFRTPYGWHIAEVLGRRTYDMSDELREQDCRQQIGNRKVDEEREIWRRRIRDEAYVQKKL